MKYLYYLALVVLLAVLVLLTCYCLYPSPNIYNDGTAWKMPRGLKVSDFYYDIESAYQYDGRSQPRYLKVKSFFWQDENNENFTIESAFFIVKPLGMERYALEYRRYIILANEEEKSDAIRDIWQNYQTEIVRGSTLYLKNSETDRQSFGWWRRTGWNCSDGLYEKHILEMFYAERYGPVLDQIINDAERFVFHFPSLNLETNGIVLESSELERIKTKGTLVELENNSFFLTAEELDNLKRELTLLIELIEKEPPKVYLERVKERLLK
jgi:hypothetical protein